MDLPVAAASPERFDLTLHDSPRGRPANGRSEAEQHFDEATEARLSKQHDNAELMPCSIQVL